MDLRVHIAHGTATAAFVVSGREGRIRRKIGDGACRDGAVLKGGNGEALVATGVDLVSVLAR